MAVSRIARYLCCSSASCYIILISSTAAVLIIFTALEVMKYILLSLFWPSLSNSLTNTHTCIVGIVRARLVVLEVAPALVMLGISKRD